MKPCHEKAVFALAVLGSSMSAHSNAHAGTNLLANPSLENFQPVLTQYRNQPAKTMVDTPADWGLVLNYPAFHTMDAAHALFGSYAYRAEIFCHPSYQNGGGVYQHSAGGMAQQYIPVKPNTTYTFSYYVRVADVKTTYAAPSVYDYSLNPADGKATWLSQKFDYTHFDNPMVSDDQENLTWNRVVLTFKTAPNADVISANAIVKADFSTIVLADFTGESHLAWIDGIQLEEGPVATAFNDNSNNAPTADAGENLAVRSEALHATALAASGSDADNDALQYRWLEGSNVLADWQPAGDNGSTPLDLSAIAILPVGEHTLTLEVTDGKATSTDSMILTVDNSAPHAGPSGSGVYQYGTPVVLGGSVSDYDGDALTATWREGENVISSEAITPLHGGTPTDLQPVTLSGLEIGKHPVALTVNDGVNTPVVSEIDVNVIDDVAPTLNPSINKTILWPPNHQLLNIAINANASDNSGRPVALSAAVTSNEAQDGLDDEDVGQDWTQPVIDQATGLINLQLRAERSGSGNGRAYTITLTAADSSNNSSSAKVVVIVPHDKRK